MLATLPTVQQAGLEVLVAAPPDGPLACELLERDIHVVPWHTTDANSLRRPLTPLRSDLSEIIRQIRPTILHANSLSTSRIAGPVAGELQTPSIGHLRDIVTLSSQAICDLNQHTRLIAVSAATRDFHVAQKLDAANCVVLHNGVDLAKFYLREPTGYLHRELALPSRARFVAGIGQLGLRKATEIALQAALKIARDLPDLQWLIVGSRTSNKLESREFEVRLHQIANQPALAGRVHFLGNRNDIPQLLNECEILVHAARQEPLGRVLLEAAASGIAIIATDVGGTADIFPPDSRAAILVPPDHPDAIANALLRLCRDDLLRRTTAANARRRAEQAFDINQTAHQLVRVYQEIM